MYYQVFYARQNEEIEKEFAIILFDDNKASFFIIELDFNNSYSSHSVYDSYPTEYDLNDFVDYLEGVMGFEYLNGNKSLERVLKEFREDTYFTFEFQGQTETLPNGFVKKLDYYGTLAVVDAGTKEALFSVQNDFRFDAYSALFYKCAKAFITDYEDTDEYKKLQEEQEQERLKELERQQEEQRKKELEIAKAKEENRLSEYYENLLREQEQRHKQELIALKLKEIEELQKE